MMTSGLTPAFGRRTGRAGMWIDYEPHPQAALERGTRITYLGRARR